MSPTTNPLELTMDENIRLTFDRTIKPERWLTSATLTIDLTPVQVEDETFDADAFYAAALDKALGELSKAVYDPATLSVRLIAQGRSYRSWRVVNPDPINLDQAPAREDVFDTLQAPAEGDAPRRRRSDLDSLNI